MIKVVDICLVIDGEEGLEEGRVWELVGCEGVEVNDMPDFLDLEALLFLWHVWEYKLLHWLVGRDLVLFRRSRVFVDFFYCWCEAVEILFVEKFGEIMWILKFVNEIDKFS